MRRLLFVSVLLGVLLVCMTGTYAAPPPSSVWVQTDRVKGLERVMIQELRPRIEAGLAGAYGAAPPFDTVRVTRVEQDRLDPAIVRVVVEVETYHGAHNPLGIDSLTFVLTPSHLRLAEVHHKQHPLYRSM